MRFQLQPTNRNLHLLFLSRLKCISLTKYYTGSANHDCSWARFLAAKFDVLHSLTWDFTAHFSQQLHSNTLQYTLCVAVCAGVCNTVQCSTLCRHILCLDVYTPHVKHSQTLCVYWCVSDTVCQHCTTLCMFLQCLAVLTRLFEQF